MISRERWQRLRPIVQPALELPPEDVSSHLDRACRGAPELREEAEAVLRACRDAERSLGFLESPAAELAAPLLEREKPPSEFSAELEAGTAVGSYTIERRLGRGGMGVVYLAHDDRLDRKVALKLLPGWLGMSEAAKRRFVQEAKAASRRDHPNIETIYEIGETADGRLYIAMAHYEGETLQERIAWGPLDVHSALDLACQIAEGLGAAHDRGIVHRDIKPSNVIVTPDGVAKILDFGAAKIAGDRLTGTGVALGTAAYMSPEQTRREDVDRRSDIWSLGLVLYEMLAGRHPFVAHGSEATIHAIRNDEPEPLLDLRPDAPESLARAVGRCLQKDPRARYRDGAELAGELRRIQETVPGPLPSTGRPRVLRPRSARPRSRAVAAAGLALLLLIAGLAYLISSGRLPGTVQVGDVVPSASTIVVLPFSPVVEDSALRRLGRELVVTLSANLDGVGGIRAADALTVLARVDRAENRLLEGGLELARELGARSFLHGSLVRADGRVRVEMGLFDAADGESLARATATGPLDDIGVLTDSATLAILRPIWRGGEWPAPNMAAITTRSLPALRAYVEGELAFARADHRDAVRAFERAFAADSTFWLAYWRSIYARPYEASRPDSAVLARIVAHRHDLPEPDRLMVEAHAAETLGDRLETLRAVTRRFSDNWPAWYAYADELVHRGPYLGTTAADARAALERLVALNPEFAEGWRHLLLVAVLQRDTAAADRALEGLERFESPDAFVFNPDNMGFFRALHELLRSGGDLSDTIATRLAHIALRVSPRVPPGAIATTILGHGFPKAQLQQLDLLLRQRPPRELAEAGWMGKALAWASRGAWDSTLVAIDEWVRRSDDSRTPLLAYGLTVVGAWLEAIPPEVAARWRPEPERFAALASPAEMAELAWLDGILAYARDDADAIARAREEASRADAPHGGLLDTSLVAFHRYATGDREEAARGLARLEWDAAEHERWVETGSLHPYLSAVHRLAAARWVLEAGDTLQASRLLTWHEAIFGGHARAANKVVEPVALYERAKLAEARGRLREAREHYRGFLERYDRPPSPHAAWLEDALGALRRLSEGPRGAAVP